MKPIILQSLQIYIFCAAFTGSIYNLINAETMDEVLKYSVLNLIVFSFAFIISYFGFRTKFRREQE